MGDLFSAGLRPAGFHVRAVAAWAVAGLLGASLLASVANAEIVDPRRPISVAGHELGLTDAEIAQALVSTGAVICRDEGSGRAWEGSAALFLDAGQVITAAHVLMGGQLPDKVGACEFVNHANPPIRMALDLRPDAVRFGTRDTRKESGPDYAIARLFAPISGAKAYQADGKGMEAGDPIVIVSALQIEKQEDPLKEPVAQKCVVAIPVGASFITQCTGSPGESGSAAFVRVKDGSLQLRGVLSRGGGALSGGLEQTFLASIDAKAVAAGKALQKAFAKPTKPIDKGLKLLVELSWPESNADVPEDQRPAFEILVRDPAGSVVSKAAKTAGAMQYAVGNGKEAAPRTSVSLNQLLPGTYIVNLTSEQRAKPVFVRATLAIRTTDPSAATLYQRVVGIGTNGIQVRGAALIVGGDGALMVSPEPDFIRLVPPTTPAAAAPPALPG